MHKKPLRLQIALPSEKKAKPLYNLLLRYKQHTATVRYAVVCKMEAFKGKNCTEKHCN